CCAGRSRRTACPSDGCSASTSAGWATARARTPPTTTSCANAPSSSSPRSCHCSASHSTTPMPDRTPNNVLLEGQRGPDRVLPHQTASSDERLRRWRLVLGGADGDGTGVTLAGDDASRDQTLAALYGDGGAPASSSGSRRGGLAA